jgi:very-short-patch-repair endonuclease
MFKISKQILELEDATKEQFAAYLRANQTTAERKFWERVKDGQIPCLEFEQQKIISGWIVDFYSPFATLRYNNVLGGLHSAQTMLYEMQIFARLLVKLDVPIDKPLNKAFFQP